MTSGFYAVAFGICKEEVGLLRALTAVNFNLSPRNIGSRDVRLSYFIFTGGVLSLQFPGYRLPWAVS